MMIVRALEVVGDWLRGGVGKLEARATGKPYQPKNYAGAGSKGRGGDEFDEFDRDDWPDGTEFDAQGRPVFVPASAGELFWKRLLGTSWVSKQEWEADMSRRCGRPVKWEDSGPGTQVG